MVVAAVVVLTVIGLVLNFVGGGDTSDADRPGDGAVYDRIDALTSCGRLQVEFDTAAASNDRETPGTHLFDVTLSYMEAADDRLQELGCYDG